MNVISWMHILLISSPICATFKVLVVSPFPSRSHGILGDAQVKLLLEAGHEVTYITGVPKNNSHPLLNQIDVSDNEKYFPPNTFDINHTLKKEVNVKDASLFIEIITNISKGTLENKEVAKLISDVNQKFDVIITEWMFNEVNAGLSAVFDCPFIWFSTMDTHFMILRLLGETTSPSYSSSIISTNIAPLTLKQRVEELIIRGIALLVKDWVMYSAEVEIYENVFGPATAKRGKQLPSYDQIRLNASLVLGNSHVSLGQANALPQSYKPVAGYHIDPNVKPLPKDLQSIMDKATNGVIYFSLGTNVNSRDLPDVIKTGLVKVFSKLKQTVLWKFEGDFPKLPKNVHVLKWAPQQSILAHPNCVLFITHGGLLSTTEAVHFAVPIIGIPVFGDQYFNVKRAVHKGFALSVELSYNMAEDLEKAILEFSINHSYRNKIKELSFVYHHRPTTPQAEMVHWVEHVAMTRGAPHLQSPALAVAWYQELYLDFICLLVALLLLFVFLSRKIIYILRTGKPILKKKIN